MLLVQESKEHESQHQQERQQEPQPQPQLHQEPKVRRRHRKQIFDNCAGVAHK